MANIDMDHPSERLDVSFEDITYDVRENCYSTARKRVLKGVSGEFPAGQLTVIIGPSGAGKSSLMDILAGYKNPSAGTLLVNGRVRDERFFRPRSCYIMQFDVLQPLLTVREALTVAAELKLGKHVPREEKKRRVDEIMEALKLNKVGEHSQLSHADTPTGALSGGQRKRLAVGLELVSDPGVLFLDEPTSGLDSSTSKQVIAMLRGLANQGRTMVITVHQPSTPLLLMMDRIYAVHSGRCAFMGAVTQLVPYLGALGYKCPSYHNPVDFLIEVSMDERTDDRGSTSSVVDELVTAAENGKSSSWTTPAIHNLIRLDSNPVSEAVNLTALPRRPQPRIANTFIKPTRYNTSFIKQFTELFLRATKTVWRDPSLTRNNLLIHCLVGCIVGSLCYNIGGDANSLTNGTIYNSLYFSLIFVFFTAFTSVTLRFPTEMSVIRREHFNRWYSTSAYYTASIAAVVPTQVISSLLYSIIAYCLTGQPLEFSRFVAFTFIVTLTSLIAMCFGMLVGTIFDVKNGAIWGPFLVMPFVIFSGFFLRYQDAPSYFKWMFGLSFLNHGIIGLCISTFGWNRTKLEICTNPDEFCRYTVPLEYLRDLHPDQESFGWTTLWLFVTLIIITVIAYFILRLRLKYKR